MSALDKRVLESRYNSSECSFGGLTRVILNSESVPEGPQSTTHGNHRTFQPLNFSLDRDDGLELGHAQLEAGARQRLYAELHGLVEWQLVLEGPRAVVIVERWLLSVGHLVWRWWWWGGWRDW